MVPVAGWKETQVSDMDFDTIMEKAYEEYFEGLAEGEEALSFSEFKQALRIRMRSHNDAEHKYEKQNQTAEILFWNPEKRFSKFPLRAPFAVLHQKNLTTPVTIRKQPSMSKMIPSAHEERLYPRVQTPGPINLTLRG